MQTISVKYKEPIQPAIEQVNFTDNCGDKLTLGIDSNGKKLLNIKCYRYGGYHDEPVFITQLSKEETDTIINYLTAFKEQLQCGI